MDEPDKPGPMGNLIGCLAALVFAAVPAFPILFAWAWAGAHCAPVPQCRRAAEARLAVELAAVAALALLLAFAVRALVNWARLRRSDPERAGRPPIWAIPAVAVAGLLLLWGPGMIWE